MPSAAAGRFLGLAARSRLPRAAKIYEMAPRDGLQAEKAVVPTATKVELIDRLSSTGLKFIEATSFVRKDMIPQLGDAVEVLKGIKPAAGVTYSALVPNAKGMETATGLIPNPLQEIAVFAAASDAFSQRNIACNVLTSLERFRPVMATARSLGVRVRGYVSVAFGCPYAGPVQPDAVAFVTRSLLDLGCYEVSLGDTIGVGTPAQVGAVCQALREHGVPLETAVALHAHATYGSAMANVYAALQEGISVFDGSAAGLGGCPYAKGASGNISSEDLVYMLHGMGIETGVDLDRLCEVGSWISGQLGKENRSFVANARAGHARSMREAEAKLEADSVAAAAAPGGSAACAANGAVGAGGSAGGGPAPAASAPTAHAGGLDEAARKKLQHAVEASRIGLSWPPPPPGSSAFEAATTAGGRESASPLSSSAPAAPPAAAASVSA